MRRRHQHAESHLVTRIGWLRAAVLGANDGIVSTASLIVGVAAAAAKPGDVLIAGVAGLVAGAMSMAAGEYVSVSSQSDTEQADLNRERKELSRNVGFEQEELAQIYVQRGVETNLARQVAQQLMAKDALGAHARDELGISEITTARCLHLRCHFLSWRSAAVADGPYHPDALLGGCRLGCIAVVSFTSRSDRCTSRGR
jgi:vacuolar iron transporter family protein